MARLHFLTLRYMQLCFLRKPTVKKKPTAYFCRLALVTTNKSKEANRLFLFQRRYSPQWAKTSRSQSDTPQSVGLLWTSDQPDADPSTLQHTTFATNTPSPDEIRTRNPSKRAAADPCLRPRGHWDRPLLLFILLLSFSPNLTDSFCLSVTDRVQHNPTDFVVF